MHNQVEQIPNLNDQDQRREQEFEQAIKDF
jgi:hypothetical protein